MPPQNTHEIFRKELDKLEEEFLLDYESAETICVNVDKLKSFLLQSLPRASMAVVEESIEKNRMGVGYINGSEINSFGKERENALDSTLATARTIVGEDKK